MVAEPLLTVLLAKDNGHYCAKCPELDLVTELPTADSRPGRPHRSYSGLREGVSPRSRSVRHESQPSPPSSLHRGCRRMQD